MSIARAVGLMHSVKKGTGWTNVPVVYIKDTITIPDGSNVASKLIPVPVPLTWFGNAELGFFSNLVSGETASPSAYNIIAVGFAASVLVIAKRSPTGWTFDPAGFMTIFDPVTGGFEWDGFSQPSITPIYFGAVNVTFEIFILPTNPELLRY